MKKKTFKLAEYENTPQGYAPMYPPSDSLIWDRILLNVPNTQQYLKHIIRTEWKPTEGYHTPEFNQSMNIPLGTLCYYIDIYVKPRSKNKILR